MERIEWSYRDKEKQKTIEYIKIYKINFSTNEFNEYFINEPIKIAEDRIDKIKN